MQRLDNGNLIIFRIFGIGSHSISPGIGFVCRMTYQGCFGWGA
jgi:hypothetical protein